MSNFFDPQVPSQRRQVIAAVIAVAAFCTFLFVVNIFVAKEIAKEVAIPPAGESDWSRGLVTVKSVIDSLIAAAIAALLLSFIFRLIVNLIDPRDRVIEIAPSDTTARLQENARNTQSYIFIGNTATFVTASIIPILVDIARLTNRRCSIDLFILDPMSAQAVKSYISHKNRVAIAISEIFDKKNSRWIQQMEVAKVDDEDQVVGKLVAAIYLSAFTSLQSSMQMRVFLRDSFTSFGVDMSDKEVVLTQESNDEAAVAFSARGEFYKWYKKEAFSQQGQAVCIDFARRRNELKNLSLPHPSGRSEIIRSSLICLLRLFPYLSSLSERQHVLDYAVVRIKSPTHSYRSVP